MEAEAWVTIYGDAADEQHLVDVRFTPKSGHFSISWDASRIALAASMGAGQPRARLSLRGRPAWQEAQVLYKTRER